MIPFHRRLAASLLAAAGAALLPDGAFAHGDDGDFSGDASWGLGLAVMNETQPYRDFDDKVEAWPLITFENRWVRVFGPGAELKLGRSGPVSFGLLASYSGDGYKASDSDFLDGMARRKASFWLGGRAALHTELGDVSAEWTGDASSYSKGQRFKVELEHRFSFGQAGITPRLGATWYDSKFVRYYYGVDASEARADRPAYRPGSTVNTSLGVRVDYRLAPKQTLFADVGVTALGSAIKDSPLVDRSSVPELRLGYLYRF